VSKTFELAYGKKGLRVEFPEDCTTVIEPRFVPGIDDEATALTTGLRNPVAGRPLKEVAVGARSVAISVCDVTRAIPTRRILPSLLKELDHLDPARITILIATGTHRASTPAELKQIVGEDILGKFRVIDHDCLDASSLADLGTTTRGTPIQLNRNWIESEVRITVGFVEPHFFAGFSGGPKLVAPGLAGLETVLSLHSASLIADPNSTWGVIEENPLHSEIREIAQRTGVTFNLDVSINRKREITGVFCGELFASHRAARERVRETSMQAVDAPFDIVVTTNSGYPLDLNLYQSVKGMSAAARVVKEGGIIICAAECSDGIPDHGCYGEILSQCRSPREVIDLVMAPGYRRQDQWQAQIQAQVQLKADVFVYSDGLSDDQIRRALLKPLRNLEELVRSELDRRGPEARLCVLPEGPQTIPYLRLGRT